MKNNSLYDIEYFQKMKSAHQQKIKRAKRRRRISLIVLVLIIIYLVSPLSRIQNVEVKNENIYSSSKIKELANVNSGDFRLLHPSFIIKNNLHKSNLFKDINVSIDWKNNVIISVVENRILFHRKEKNKIIFYDQALNRLVFDNENTKRMQAQTPELIGKINDDLIDKLVENLNRLNKSVLDGVSQIKHIPKKYDSEYFEFIMNDKKKIFIRTSLEDIVKVGENYYSFAAKTKYKCTIIEFINSENRAIVKKCP